ncbi:MAG TPA: methyltransferase domain-containing protein [Aquabacterium sp.]|nr:methyltransferase domain-containing protein [Aquabacterium sp.]HQC94842.1 methyltransferase domain-containing protein [Aquabacterium sp.]
MSGISPATMPEAPTSTDAPTSADALQQAMALHQQGQADAAEQLYLQIPEGEPQYADALHLRGLLAAKRREWETAQALIWQAIQRKPDEAMFHNNLGNVCLERGMAHEAGVMYARAIELDGMRLDALSNLGLLLARTGRADEAERLLLHAVELARDNADFRQNLANLYLRQDRLQDALQQCHDGLVRAPRSRTLRSLLVLAYAKAGRIADAQAVLQAWIDSEPDDPYPRHHLAALTGENVPARAGDAYVTEMFDGFAAGFDGKLANLDYQAPQHVATALARLLGSAAPVASLLDAGCGTGLCGPLLAPLAQRITGVDLSEGMLRRAHDRGVYADLFQGELVAFLQSRPLGFDAVTAADTLCYFGALDDFAAAALSALRPGGWLVFTVEALDDAAPEAVQPGCRLQYHGRYSHARGATLAALQRAGLVDAAAEPVFLRKESGQPVQGWLVTARRPA